MFIFFFLCLTVPVSADSVRIDDFEVFSQPVPSNKLTLDSWTVVYSRGETFVGISVERDPLLSSGVSRVLRISGRSNSYTISKNVGFKWISEYPYLEWKWKVTEVPWGADISNPDKDDGPAQMYVNFDLKDTFLWYPKLLSVCYFYGTTMNPGTVYYWEGFGTFTKFIPIRSVAVHGTGRWYVEKRNVLQDYRDAVRDFLNAADLKVRRKFRQVFLKTAGIADSEPGSLFQENIPELEVYSLAIWVDSNDTRKTAESFYDDIYFCGNDNYQ